MISRLRHAGRALLGDRLAARLSFFFRYPSYYWKLRAHLDIEGWLGYSEAVFLYEAARSLGNSRPIVVEIGSWQGRSAVVLGFGLRDRGSGRLVCIDPFNADGDRLSRTRYEELRAQSPVSLKGRLMRNIRRNGLEEIVEVHEAYSDVISRGWYEPVDMLFIDGNHEYEAVRSDFLSWSPFLVHGGLLVMDDVCLSGGGHEGPARIVRQFVLGKPGWTRQRQIGSLYVAQREGVNSQR